MLRTHPVDRVERVWHAARIRDVEQDGAAVRQVVLKIGLGRVGGPSIPALGSRSSRW